MEIVGLIVRAFPCNRDAIIQELQCIAGLEVHNDGREGRLVATIEQPSSRGLKSALDQLESIKGILSTSVAFQYSDELERHSEPETHS